MDPRPPTESIWRERWIRAKRSVNKSLTIVPPTRLQCSYHLHSAPLLWTLT